MVTENDIKNSLYRLQNAFNGKYGEFSIQEGKRKVGMLTLDGDKKRIYITYRGSVNSFFETFSCLFIWKKNVEGLNGRVHAGLYNAFQKTKTSFQAVLEKVLKKMGVSLNQIEFVVEGYSRGSGLAALTALFLKQNFPGNNVDVLTYSTMKLFDQKGVNSYQNVIKDHHWSFLCNEDLFPRWIGPSCFGFHSIGKKITFSAQISQGYKQRVNEKKYTYLGQIPVVSWLIRRVIPVKYWEAHMPQTYQDLAAINFTKLKNPLNNPSC
jgi:hypothetical protein